MSKNRPFWPIFILGCLLVSAVMAQEEPADKPAPAQEPPRAKRNPFVPQVPMPEEEVVKKEPVPAPDKKGEEKPKPVEKLIDTAPKPVEIKLGTPKLNITGLIWNSPKPQAIVNGNIVTVGDRLFGVPSDSGEVIPEIKINDITKEGLSVSFANKTVVLKPTVETTQEKPQPKKEKK